MLLFCPPHFWFMQGAGSGLAAAEDVAQGVELVLVDEAYAGLGDLALEHAFVAGVAEQTDIHGLGAVQEVLERDVVDEVLREILVGVGIGGVIAAHYDLEYSRPQ